MKERKGKRLHWKSLSRSGRLGGIWVVMMNMWYLTIWWKENVYSHRQEIWPVLNNKAYLALLHSRFHTYELHRLETTGVCIIVTIGGNTDICGEPQTRNCEKSPCVLTLTNRHFYEYEV